MTPPLPTSRYTTLDEWLAHCERLHAVPIDMGLDRVQAVRERLGLPLGGGQGPVVFTVAGTNGKGSTCAMLESILHESGYRVGVYTSPHLVRFEERCRINTQQIEASALLPHFEAVEVARGDVSLTYFEFTTLAILHALSLSGLDAVVLEVGLGGRLDAVNIVDTDCAVITSVDIDHVDFLGPDREAIGREKAGIMRAGRPAVVSDPVPPRSVVEHAEQIGADLWLSGRDHNVSGDKQQWAWAGRGRRYAGLAYPALRGANQLINASGVLAALQAVRDRLPITAQAVRVGLARVELPGRFQIVPGQPTLVLDVAHNPHAAAALAQNLDQMGFFPRTVAVLGAMRDKDIAQVVTKLLPLVDVWCCADLPTPRAATAAELKEAIDAELAACKAAGRVLPGEVRVSLHPSPQDALDAAVAGSDPADRIVVFGSFFTVGGVLQNGVPRLDAQHLTAKSGA